MARNLLRFHGKSNKVTSALEDLAGRRFDLAIFYYLLDIDRDELRRLFVNRLPFYCSFLYTSSKNGRCVDFLVELFQRLGQRRKFFYILDSN